MFRLRMLTFTTTAVLLLTNPIKSKSLSLWNTNSSTASDTSTGLDFIGKSSSQITLPLSVSDSHQIMSFPRWLSSKYSHHHVLGTKAVSLRDDGKYDCHLPSLSFFGLNIKPICTSAVEVDRNIQEQILNDVDITKIEMSNHSSRTRHQSSSSKSDFEDEDIESVSLKVTIQDSILQVETSSESLGNAIGSLMEMCKLQGGNKIKCIRDNDTWVLSSDLELQLNIFLGSNSNGQPKFLPPGFRSIGERILKKTCEKRVEENLISIKSGFEEYLTQSQLSDSII